MDAVDNNQFEVKSSKRKIQSGPNVYLNPALDLLANEDPMCNTAMEITPNKRRKTTKSEIAAFENTALDLGISKAAVNEFLQRELNNVRKNVKHYETPIKLTEKPTISNPEPIYANLTEVANEQNNFYEHNKEVIPDSIDDTNLNTIEDEIEMDSGISEFDGKFNTGTNSELVNNDISAISNTTNIQTNITNQIFVNNTSNLSFIDRLALDSPATSNQSLYLDDDLNESNIMEIKTITIITKKKIVSNKKNTNPFLDPNLNVDNISSENPFLDDKSQPALEYNVEAVNKFDNNVPNNLIPRKLFASDTNSTISTVNESSLNAENHEYENIDSYRSESPVYENIGDDISDMCYNKQSKILGYDVSQFSAVDIMNLNKKNTTNESNESNESKKDFKHILKASNKLSKKVFKTLKKKLKGDKVEQNTTLNPYEVPRKLPKQKTDKKDSGIENPALKLDNSDEIEIEEIENENEYETIKTIENTRLNTNVTPLKERAADSFDLSHNKTYTPGKKVRFDATLNREKIITGNSFNSEIQSPGFDSKVEKYHDELENCINERKFLQQNM
ncbi:protein PF3D7_1417600-like [Vanessa cardui]|uniref:protein PF3D7_1417600-like n=1 Tax=Vanessa cardui TaxID=171605 RepID=UPI001F12B44E|nr:protein PF3D7_1417600-like [Vanessa cardui]